MECHLDGIDTKRARCLYERIVVIVLRTQEFANQTSRKIVNMDSVDFFTISSEGSATLSRELQRKEVKEKT